MTRPTPRQEPSMLAITLGDCNGIGPEVTSKATATFCREDSPPARLVWIGSRSVVREQLSTWGGSLPPSWIPEDGPPQHNVVLWDPEPSLGLRWNPGRITAEAARAAMDWIAVAVQGCRTGLFDGVVTAPICKEGLQKAGYTWPGHTEYVAHLAHIDDFAMLLMGEGLRVALATRHLPLREVPDRLTSKELRKVIALTCAALPWFGCPKGRVAVCGLNPHAGDGGALGDEEKTIIAPVVREAQRRDLPVVGPVPADTVFYQALQGHYDAVIAMYHDQGLAPLKMLAFDTGINVTLGLPFVRTSPDHGTAFDLAGQGIARENSMLEALRLAATLAARTNPWTR